MPSGSAFLLLPPSLYFIGTYCGTSIAAVAFRIFEASLVQPRASELFCGYMIEMHAFVNYIIISPIAISARRNLGNAKASFCFTGERKILHCRMRGASGISCGIACLALHQSWCVIHIFHELTSAAARRDVNIAFSSRLAHYMSHFSWRQLISEYIIQLHQRIALHTHAIDETESARLAC